MTAEIKCDAHRAPLQIRLKISIFDFKIIDETEAYLVVDKPPFLLVHPTKPGGTPTLWRELRELLAFEIANGGQVSIMNRLDRETSGLVLVAKTSAAARRFGLLIQQQRLKKEYLAIVWGWPDWEMKIVDAPLDRQGKHRQSAIWLKQMIHPAGAPAKTEFHVERRFVGATIEKFSLIRAIPHTGRTHQIRVHLASTGHPIVGDKIYGRMKNFISSSLRQDGRAASIGTCSCRATLFMPQSSWSKASTNGPAPYLSILPISVAAVYDRRFDNIRRSQSAATEVRSIAIESTASMIPRLMKIFCIALLVGALFAAQRGFA